MHFVFPSKSNYIFIFRESDPYRHLVLNNWVFLSDLFYKMNENVKQNQPVSLFSFLILRVAGLLNSADFSRSCTSSSCNISLSFSSSALQLSKNMIKNYFTIFCKKMSFFVRNSSNFLHTIFIPQATIGTKNPLNPAKIGAKKHTSFIKEEIKLWNLALGTDPSKGGL